MKPLKKKKLVLLSKSFTDDFTNYTLQAADLQYDALEKKTVSVLMKAKQAKRHVEEIEKYLKLIEKMFWDLKHKGTSMIKIS